MRQFDHIGIHRDVIDGDMYFIAFMHIATHGAADFNLACLHFIRINDIVTADGVNGHRRCRRGITRKVLRVAGILIVTLNVMTSDFRHN
ncbi:hypothetical protein D3C81_2009060 [compost metagenome]